VIYNTIPSSKYHKHNITLSNERLNEAAKQSLKQSLKFWYIMLIVNILVGWMTDGDLSQTTTANGKDDY
jgi:hypothetical protein